MTVPAPRMPPVPPRIARLPLNESGYPVPWFVAWIDGKPDFRVIGENKIDEAIRFKVCWLCGQPLGSFKAFVIGPMCAINRVSSEPPSHRECAEFAAMACPFLINPKHKRRETALPEEYHDAGGVGLKRNPGVALVWITKSFTMQIIDADPAHGIQEGVLFQVGDPEETLWFARGRAATREEVLESINSGLPLLRKPAEEEGEEAVEALERMHRAALDLVP